MATASSTPKTKTKPALKLLLLFSDDSTLFFALRMRSLLQAVSKNVVIEMGWVYDENALSFRQMEMLLPEGPDQVVRDEDFQPLLDSGAFSAVLTSRTYGGLGNLLKSKLRRVTAGRTCVISFLGGLDFSPQNGFWNRRHADAIYLFPRDEIRSYKTLAENWDVTWQDVCFGHPSFTSPKPATATGTLGKGDIYFFTQALSPSTKNGRLHMLRAMAAMARANPDRTIWIKLRHLPQENRKHLHTEIYDYPGLLAELGDLPDNLKTTACTMDEALKNAALGVTCTSTAAIDVVREGLPCMVNLDYVDNFSDPLNVPMRDLFAASGLITPLDDMLNLRFSAPDQKWLDNMFCGANLGQQVLDTIAKFESRPFQYTPPEGGVLAED